MGFSVSTELGQRFVEADPKQLVLSTASTMNAMLEACFNHHTHRLLLYSDNLAPEFFDLSSGLAGSVLQTCRNYHILVAVILSPTVHRSSRFNEVIAEENSRGDFRFFNDRNTAVDWLCST